MPCREHGGKPAYARERAHHHTAENALRHSPFPPVGEQPVADQKDAVVESHPENERHEKTADEIDPDPGKPQHPKRCKDAQDNGGNADKDQFDPFHDEEEAESHRR